MSNINKADVYELIKYDPFTLQFIDNPTIILQIMASQYGTLNTAQNLVCLHKISSIEVRLMIRIRENEMTFALDGVETPLIVSKL